jgi:hypothetical protein
MLNIRVLSVLFIIFSLISLNSGAAQDCTSYISDEDYYDLKDNITLSKQERVILADLAERLIGDWRGELDQIECKGNIKQPEIFVDSSYAKLEIREHSKDRQK